jgi:hypothetical protein
MSRIYVLSLLNICYFEIPPFLAEGLSLDTTFHLGSTVNMTIEPGMNAATAPKQRVGKSREEMMNCATIQEKHYLKQFYSTEN